MGNQVVYQVRDRDIVIATLFSNSTHTVENPEVVFTALLQTPEVQSGPNKLIERLIGHRYHTSKGINQSGDRMFWMVPATTAHLNEIEAIYNARHIGVAEEFADKGYSKPRPNSWEVEKSVGPSAVPKGGDAKSSNTPAVETPMLLDAPADLFARLQPVANKKHKGGFVEFSKRLRRPYYKISEEQCNAIEGLAGDSDVVLLDGTTQATWGNADGGYALMPLYRPL